jgi:hypothetical protein
MRRRLDSERPALTLPGPPSRAQPVATAQSPEPPRPTLPSPGPPPADLRLRLQLGQ